MATNDDLFISLTNLSKSFGQAKAVDDVSFNIRRGEFFSLLGPSGCGKTTLLRMLAGFELPTSGGIVIDGQPMSMVPPNKRPTNMVFQSYAIFPHLTVCENIAYGLRQKRLPKPELDRIVDQALEMIKLPGYGARSAHQLSGGQRQRVALARALVCRPKVLLLDEPLGALDKRMREEMQIELRQLQQQVGITFIFVTHDQEEALTLSDRIAVMSKGKVLQIEDAASLYEAPNCREVAEFIGSMNFFDGAVKGIEGGYALVDVGYLGSMRVPVRRFEVRAGGLVTIAVRPEKVRIEWTRPIEPENVVEGCVGTEAYFGDRSHYYVEVPGFSHRIAVAHQNVVRTFESSNARGGKVWLTWRTDSAVLLTRE